VPDLLGLSLVPREVTKEVVLLSLLRLIRVSALDVGVAAVTRLAISESAPAESPVQSFRFKDLGVAYILLGMALRMAFTLGLQTDSHQFPGDHQYLRCRAWWAFWRGRTQISA
jgi:hypothetical protein